MQATAFVFVFVCAVHFTCACPTCIHAPLCAMHISVCVPQAIHTAADLAEIHKSKVTVLVVDAPDAGDPKVKLSVINK